MHSSTVSLLQTAPPIDVLLIEGASFQREGVAGPLRMHRDLALIGCAADAREAVRLALKARPNVVVVNLPAESGPHEIVRQIRYIVPSARVLALIDSTEPMAVRFMRDAGAHAVLPKSAHASDLVSTVRRIAAPYE